MMQAMPPGSAGARPPVTSLPAAPVLRRAAFLSLLLALAGCGTGTDWGWMPGGLGTAAVTSPPPATGVVLPARAADPLAAFAARAQTGQMETVSMPDGGRVISARMVRVYNAASGRECRELQFGPSGVAGGAPGATYCNDPAQGWVAARALLRGGAVYRP